MSFTDGTIKRLLQHAAKVRDERYNAGDAAGTSASMRISKDFIVYMKEITNNYLIQLGGLDPKSYLTEKLGKKNHASLNATLVQHFVNSRVENCELATTNYDEEHIQPCDFKLTRSTAKKLLKQAETYHQIATPALNALDWHVCDLYVNLLHNMISEFPKKKTFHLHDDVKKMINNSFDLGVEVPVKEEGVHESESDDNEEKRPRDD